MKIEIKTRDGRPLYTCEAASLRAALERAVKEGAYLWGADLTDADLTGASLAGAKLTCTNLRGANLTGASLGGADLEGVNLTGAFGVGAVPVVPGLDAEILARVEANPESLDMGVWHSCETTHCRAGWAIHLAGEAGAKLEEAFGSSAAGALIYHASAGYVPDFYASTEDALDDLRRRAKATKETP